MSAVKAALKYKNASETPDHKPRRPNTPTETKYDILFVKNKSASQTHTLILSPEKPVKCSKTAAKSVVKYSTV
jgi:hypothetical protein